MPATAFPRPTQWLSDRLCSFTVAGAAPGLVPVNDWNAHRLPVSLADIHDRYREGSEAPDNFADDANRRKSDWQAGTAPISRGV